MTYTGLELFMENLKQLSYSTHNPLINNPKFLLERPQIQLIYEELSFMIQIMFVEKQKNLLEIEQVNNLKTRFKDVAQEAHSIVGLFVYSINYTDTTGPPPPSNTTGPPPPSRFDFIKGFSNCMRVKRSINNECSQRSINNKCSQLNLENVMKDLKSIKEQFIMILDRLKMDSSPSTEPLKTQNAAAAGTSHPRNPLRMKKVSEEIIVGHKHDAELIRDKLVEDQKQLNVVSIVGMGGVGKTTLATKVFNDPFVVYHFDARAWVTVSQSYDKHDLLIQIVASIGIEFDPVSASYSELRGKLHKSLMDKRYLIVVDDIWSVEAWNDLKLFFPDGNTSSRILLTSRVKEVALHAKSHGFVHRLEYLTDEESWELLCKKVFHGNDFPKSLIKPGMQIAKNCHGLPLAVVVIAGVLAKEASQNDSWERIAQRVSSYIVNDENGHIDILGLSFEHLPPHLKDCFLYLGGFPEDYKFRVRELIWLWIAEGFVQEDGNRSLEEIGEDYMMELHDRNLVVVAEKKFNGAIKACSVHDLLRELCLERATKGNFCVKISKQMSISHSARQYKPCRIFTNRDFIINNSFDEASPWVHSLLCFHNDTYMIDIPKGYFNYYPLLIVLDLQKCRIADFPRDIGLLVHLRYLAFSCTRSFPSSICNLWSLHTVIVRSNYRMHLPETISNLVNLRHLWSEGVFYFPSIEKPMNLRTISEVVLDDVAASWETCFPTIQKLICTTSTKNNQDFKSLNSLKTLIWNDTASSGSQFGDRVRISDGEFQKIHVTFPISLKKLSLSGCCLPWSDMSIIQSLPNLEVLNILYNAFMGPRWETGEAQFQQLKYLKLEQLDIQQWEASSNNFPCLKHLVLGLCPYLEEIPLEIGDISTLELIDVDDSSSSLVDSLDKILEEQQNYGNYDLKINVRNELQHLNLKNQLRRLTREANMLL